MSAWLEQFQFIRPLWLLALPLVFFIVSWRIKQIRTAGWSGHIAQDKLAYLSVTATETGTRRQWLTLPPLLFACIALAGPSWKSLPDNIAGNRQAMVILFDLSISMLAEDIKPTRLERASLKLIDLLRKRIDGETALIAYAGDAHRVSPLTDDPATIESLVKILHPSIMPVNGSQTELAVDLALSLFKGADLEQGDIVLITDGVHEDAVASIKQSLPRGYRLSILGVGSTAGAPIPTDKAGLMRDSRDQLIIASLDDGLLRDLATHFAGRYSRVTPDDRDVNYLSSLSRLPFDARIAKDRQSFDSAHDSGYWLLLLLLPIAAYLFRQNVIWLLLPLAVFPPDTYAWSWTQLWYSNDQRAASALNKDQAEVAAELFDSPQWAAVARYRNGDFAQAAVLFATGEQADNFYNLGNAEARAGNLERAMTAFDTALKLEPAHQDALYNREFLREIIRLRNETDDENSDEQNRRGSGSGESEGESSDAESEEVTGGNGQQQQIGGSAGAGQSLNQQAAQDGGPSTSGSDQHEPMIDDERHVTAVQQPGAISSRNTDDGTTADSGALEIENSRSGVLNPYSEQWLRTLPKDPGGYLRRKFQYQSRLRIEENEGEPPALKEGRY